MVGYTFKPRFVEPITSGAKRQTIRRPRVGRSRHAIPGGPITCLTGPRFKPVTFHRATCKGAGPIRIRFKLDEIKLPHAILSGAGAVDAFAMMDGFADWDDMKTFWKETHDELDTFDGVLITW